MWGVPWASCVLPDMVPVKPVAGGAASVERAPSHAPVILFGANLFHCPLLYIPASVLLVWAWRGMPSGRIVYFRKSNNFNPNNQTFVKFFMSLRYSLKIIHYLCTRAVPWPTTCPGGCPAALSVEVGMALPSPCQAVSVAARQSFSLISLYHGGIFVRHMASSPCTTGAYSSATRPHLPVPRGHILPPPGLIHVSRVWAQGISETILFLNIPHCVGTRCWCGNH